MAFVRNFSFFLAPSVATMAVSLFMVPITTYVLGPEAFGVYGLMMALTGVGWSVSLIGSSAVCNVHFPRLDTEGRRCLITTLLVVAIAMAILFCLLCVAMWPLLSGRVDGYSAVPLPAFVLTLLTIVAGVPWMVAQDVITLDGRARGFAAITMAQTIAAAAVTIVALYVLRLGLLSLFVSALAASTVTMLGAIRLLWPYLKWHFDREWFREVMRVGPASASSSTLDAAQAVFERSYIGSVMGVGMLGLYVHALNYRIMIAQVLKAAARPIWPVSLQEARAGDGLFRQTRVVWDAMYILVAAAGVTFAVFGRDTIGWLTHGRFADAHVTVTFFMIFLLLQNAGKAQTALVYHERAVRHYYWIQSAANVAWVIALIVLVRLFGIVGAVLALCAQQIILRCGVMWLARRRGSAPFGDGWLLFGVLLIGVALAALRVSPGTIEARTIIWLAAMAVLSAAGVQVVRRFLAAHVPRFA